jgi:tripartite-type tricarboxylate transporter receptor subunit TctC
MKRKLLSAIALATSAALLAPVAQAQQASRPSGPVRFIVGIGPGSGADIMTRFLVERYTQMTGQAAVAENRTGGDQIPAVMEFLNAPADGRTLLYITPTPALINPLVRKDLPYSQRDIRPVAFATRSFAVMVVNPDSSFRTLADVVAAARAKPGTVSFANYGHHYRLGALALEKEIGGTFNHVAYKGAAQANGDVIGGAIDVHVTDVGGAVPLIKSGKLRALAVTGKTRHPMLPDVPTIAESGYPNYNLYVWAGYGLSAKTPEPIFQKVEADLLKIIRSAEYAAFNVQQGGGEVVGGTGREFADAIDADTARISEVLKYDRPQ